MAKPPPIKLMWLDALMKHLVEGRASNHTSILALAVVLQSYGDEGALRTLQVAEKSEREVLEGMATSFMSGEVS